MSLACWAAVGVGCIAARPREGDCLRQLRLGHEGMLQKARGVGAVARNPEGGSTAKGRCNLGD
jgi:hypothetical protein